MKLTQENYEFLMFELLEGNLNNTEKNILLEQINKDAFYQREWILMQHAVATPDNTLMMPYKDSLLKPEGRTITFISFNFVSKIAASLLILGSLGLWYYTNNNQASLVQVPSEKTVTPKIKNPEKQTITEDHLKGNSSGSPEKIVNRPASEKAFKNAPNINPVLSNDSLLKFDVPEMLLIKPIGNEGIAYDLSLDKPIVPGTLIMEKRKVKELGKIGSLIAQAEKIRTIGKEYWDDIPNLKLKITPKLKERNIGFELKGETIYANAVLELK